MAELQQSFFFNFAWADSPKIKSLSDLAVLLENRTQCEFIGGGEDTRRTGIGVLIVCGGSDVRVSGSACYSELSVSGGFRRCVAAQWDCTSGRSGAEGAAANSGADGSSYPKDWDKRLGRISSPA